MPSVRKKKHPVDELVTTVVAALSDKKAIETAILDFRGMKSTVADVFVICQGTSRTQVEALANHTIMEVRKKTGWSPSHVEGLENAEWVLIDYFDAIVHIFNEGKRKFYNLEQLWADAKITHIRNQE